MSKDPVRRIRRRIVEDEYIYTETPVAPPPQPVEPDEEGEDLDDDEDGDDE